jgi:hypothetical protein
MVTHSTDPKVSNPITQLNQLNINISRKALHMQSFQWMQDNGASEYNTAVHSSAYRGYSSVVSSVLKPIIIFRPCPASRWPLGWTLALDASIGAAAAGILRSVLRVQHSHPPYERESMTNFMSTVKYDD